MAGQLHQTNFPVFQEQPRCDGMFMLAARRIDPDHSRTYLHEPIGPRCRLEPPLRRKWAYLPYIPPRTDWTPLTPEVGRSDVLNT